MLSGRNAPTRFSAMEQMSKVLHPGPVWASSTYEWQAAPRRWLVIRALI